MLRLILGRRVGPRTTRLHSVALIQLAYLCFPKNVSLQVALRAHPLACQVLQLAGGSDRKCLKPDRGHRGSADQGDASTGVLEIRLLRRHVEETDNPIFPVARSLLELRRGGSIPPLAAGSTMTGSHSAASHREHYQQAKVPASPPK